MTEISSAENIRQKSSSKSRSRSTRRFYLWQANEAILNCLYKINDTKDPAFSSVPFDVIISAVDIVDQLRINSNPELYRILKQIFKEYPWFADYYIKLALNQTNQLFNENGILTTDEPDGTYTGFL